ncbi:MAG: DUF2076 family protein [Pseudomonadota bacterium]
MQFKDEAAIAGLFDRLAQTERDTAPRDPAAEAYLRRRLAGQPNAPYYMAQTIIALEAALEASQAEARARQAERSEPADPQGRAPREGGGFLAGAAQTALGVAGGLLVVDALGALGGAAAAPQEEMAATPAEDPAACGPDAEIGADAAEGGDWLDDLGGVFDVFN